VAQPSTADAARAGDQNFLANERTGKKTNQALYAWLKREVRGLYGQVFQFAFDVAKKAERALQHELGKPDVTFLQFGYMAGKEGLLRAKNSTSTSSAWRWRITS
jgi:hypothetical protein